AASVLAQKVFLVFVTAGIAASSTVGRAIGKVVQPVVALSARIGRGFFVTVVAALGTSVLVERFVRALVEIPVVGGALNRLAGAITTVGRITGATGMLRRIDRADSTVDKMPKQGGTLKKIDD